MYEYWSDKSNFKHEFFTGFKAAPLSSFFAIEKQLSRPGQSKSSTLTLSTSIRKPMPAKKAA